MNEYLVNSTDLEAVADAIREKTGGSEALVFPGGFVEAIGEMSGDNGSGESSGGDSTLADSIINGSITEISSNVTEIRQYAFYDCSKLKSASFPKAILIYAGAFQNCSALEDVHFPLVEGIGSNCFSSCQGLVEIDLPKITNLGTYAFNGCVSLKSLILRSETKCPYGGANAGIFCDCSHFLGTADDIYNPNGLKDGYIYVPSALVYSYKTDTNWKTYATQFRALEDFTVDGTITGELDPNKVKENGLDVQFDAMGGSVNESCRTVVYNGAYSELPTPTKEGSTFEGWYTERYGAGDEVTGDTIVTKTAPHTLYASWTSTSGGGNEEPT